MRGNIDERDDQRDARRGEKRETGLVSPEAALNAYARPTAVSTVDLCGRHRDI